MKTIWLVYALSFVASRAGATKFYCDTVTDSTHQNGIQITSTGAYSGSCLPPNLESVEVTSFSIVFKAKDGDINKPLVATLYDTSNPDLTKPAQFVVMPNAGPCKYYGGSTGTTDKLYACYQKVPFTNLKPGGSYSYNVNFNPEHSSCSGKQCDVCYSGCTVIGGGWFGPKPHPVKLAPLPTIGSKATTHILAMGDSRDGNQSGASSKEPSCKDGKWSADHSQCGGASDQRSYYGSAIREYVTVNPTLNPPVDFITHGGDLSLFDGIEETMTYWSDLGSFWSDTSTILSFGNHEFGSPGGNFDGHHNGQEIFGEHTDTCTDAMVAPPQTPTALKGSGLTYPPGAPTYYALNYGNVHIAYLNSQLCPLESEHYNPLHPPKTTPPKYDCADGHSHDVNTNGANETATDHECDCYAMSVHQRNWLKEDLMTANADPAIDWIFVSSHKAYWSNGELADGANGEWTNTVGKQEYTNASKLKAVADPYNVNKLMPLDAMYQMYNVDLVLSSHAHYYELVFDIRNRDPSDVKGLPHMLIGGSGSAEQLYQCPQTDGCHPGKNNHSADAPHPYLPDNVKFQYATDSKFYVGDILVTGTTLTYQALPVTQLHNGKGCVGEADGNTCKRTGATPANTLSSRKSLIRSNPSVANSRFNGCRVQYPPSGGITAATEINCHVK